MRRLWPHLNLHLKSSPENSVLPRVPLNHGADLNGKQLKNQSSQFFDEETCLNFLKLCNYDVMHALLRAWFESESLIRLHLIKKRRRIDPFAIEK